MNIYTTHWSDTEDIAFENACPFSEVPRIPFLEIFLRMRKEHSTGAPKVHHLFGEYFKKFDSNIVMFKLPFIGYQLMLQDPEDAKALLLNDGKNPIEPGFDFFVKYRHHRKDLFPKDTGKNCCKNIVLD